MYKCESWTVKKAENWRTDVFKLWCWRRLLRIPCTARRANQVILKEINLGYSLEVLMLKLKLQYFGHLMQWANSSEKILMLGKVEGKRRRGWQRMRQLDDITDSMDMSLSKSWETVKDRKPGVLQSTGSQSRTWLSNWTTKGNIYFIRAEYYLHLFSFVYKNNCGAACTVVSFLLLHHHKSSSLAVLLCDYAYEYLCACSHTQRTGPWWAHQSFTVDSPCGQEAFILLLIILW